MQMSAMDEGLENIYELSNDDFFNRCLNEYKEGGLFSDFDTFCEDQLEHMDLLADKYRNAVRNNEKLPISKVQFIKLKKYRKYFIKIKENPIKTFDELFEEAIKFNKIENPVNDAHKESLRSLHNFSFNSWLQKNKNWELGDADNYRRLLTPENFNIYLTDDKQETVIAQLKMQAQEDQRKLDWMEKDERYWVRDAMEQIKIENSDYKSLQNQICENGRINANTGKETVKIFTPELVFIFFFDFPVKNMETEETVSLRRSEYFDSYVTAYSEGVAYFKNEFHVSNDILYAPGSNYVANLHFQYYHLEIDDIFDGWQFVRKRYPTIVTHKEIKRFGFYSGIVSALYELMDKHPIPFKKFNEPCDFNAGEVDEDSESIDSMPEEQATITVEPTVTVDDEFDVLRNTVKDYLEPLQDIFRDPTDYENAITSLSSFFQNKPSIPSKPIFIKNGNKTKLGKELGKLYQMEANKPITKEYLLHCKNLFSVFSQEELDGKKLQFTNLYKYFTTKKKH